VQIRKRLPRSLAETTTWSGIVRESSFRLREARHPGCEDNRSDQKRGEEESMRRRCAEEGPPKGEEKADHRVRRLHDRLPREAWCLELIRDRAQEEPERDEE